MLKNAGNLEISRGFGYDVDISMRYWRTSIGGLSLGLIQGVCLTTFLELTILQLKQLTLQAS